MKKNLMLLVLLISGLPYGLMAQDSGRNPQSVTSLILRGNNHYNFGKSPLKGYYSLGSDIGVYLNDKLYLGLSQNSSLSFSDIRKEKSSDLNKTKVNEYGLEVGYKLDLASPVYLYSGVNAGYGNIQRRYLVSDGITSDGTTRKAHLSSVFAAPNVRLGVKVHKYIRVEGGVNYRYYIQDKKDNGLSTRDLNGFGGILSLVGNIPF